MTRREKYKACIEYFNKLSETFADYEVIRSNNNDNSIYLIPNGTVKQLSYHSKPAMSFRCSDHWNWYASLKKCSDEHYIQCFSVDMPYPRKRTAPGLHSKSIFGISVMYADMSGVYHCVYGEKYDKKTKSFVWIETPIETVMKRIGYKGN